MYTFHRQFQSPIFMKRERNSNIFEHFNTKYCPGTQLLHNPPKAVYISSPSTRHNISRVYTHTHAVGMVACIFSLIYPRGDYPLLSAFPKSEKILIMTNARI